MQASLNKKKISLAIACALSLSIVSGIAAAQTNPADTGYAGDQRGAVVRSGFGLCWHSGTGPAVAMPECDAAAPKLAQAAPVPAPTPMPAPPAATARPASAKLTLHADTLFDFDKAVLRPAGMSALDDFLVKTREITPEMIFAVGHSDRFGDDAYNQALSERRAGAVRTYLIGQGVAANRISTEGKGERQPVTKAGDCAGAKSATTIACLQADRRVEIEVVGMTITR